MPAGLKGSISGPGTDYFTGRPTVSSLVSTCKSFCSYLTSVYHKGFPKGRYLKKKIQTQLMPISLTFLLKSSLVSLVPFEDVFCTGPEQLQPGKGEEEPGGCGAAAGHDSEPAGSTRQRQGSRHGAAPLLQLPSEKKAGLVCRDFGICCCCLPCCLFRTCLQPGNDRQVLTLPHSWFFCLSYTS